MADNTRFDIRVFVGPEEAIKLKEAISLLRKNAEFAILESLTKTDFPDPKVTEIDPKEYPKGRIFSEAFELRWEMRDAGYSCVLAIVREPEWIPESLTDYFFPTDVISKEFQRGQGGKVEDYEVYLRPENDPNLGRTLKYECIKDRPSVENPNPILHLKRYRDANGRLIFWRYCKMGWEK